MGFFSVRACVFCLILIPNLPSLHFGGISGQFVQAMVYILVRCSRAKIPPSETKQAWYAADANQKGTIRYLQYPNLAK